MAKVSKYKNLGFNVIQKEANKVITIFTDAHLTGHIDSEVDSAFKSAASNSQQSHVSLFQRWKNRKTSTTTPKTTTVLPSITLADLSLKLATLQDQLNTLMGDVAREDDKITKMAAQMQAMSNLVDEVHATVIAS